MELLNMADVEVKAHVQFEVSIDHHLYEDVRQLSKSLGKDLENEELEVELRDGGTALEFLQRVEALVEASQRLLKAIDNPQTEVVKRALS
jgi:hypothetical protein